MVTTKMCITKERKKSILDRLSRISGQVKGIQKMTENSRYCIDILQQVSSTQEALRGVGKILIMNYLEVCAAEAIQSKKKENKENIYSELMDVIYKYAK